LTSPVPHGEAPAADTRRPGGASSLSAERAQIERRLASGEFFWLDLQRPSPEDAELLGQLFGFHPLPLEDAQQFGQRAKLEDYDDFAFIVVYGASADEDRLVEVHCFYSERYLVTVHRDDCPPFADLRARYLQGEKEHTETTPILLLHEVIDRLTDSFFPMLQEFDDDLDAIEADLEGEPADGLQQAIFALKRRLVHIRKAVGPQRDLLARLADGTAALPGMSVEAERYFRDVYDHLIRIGDLLESYRDLLSGASEVYLSTVSNRLNAVMKQLAVIATIFLPLTFVTGFFGQNFGWMVDHIGSGWTFVVVGLGSQAIALVIVLAYFRRRGWLMG
jgi:magnesium transporter